MGHVMDKKYTNNMMKMIDTDSRLWVFGYGSILWKTGFEYTTMKVGHAKGFVRRFWQGNVTHRGTPSSPGRVATLVESESGDVWGAAYELVGEEQIQNALEHLGMRECALGGYTSRLVEFFTKPDVNNTTDCDPHAASFPALTFLATPDSDLYMGPAPVDEIANRVVACRGGSGHNVEYVLRLADFFRTNLPEIVDDHLFDIDRTIRNILNERRIPLMYLLSMLDESSYYCICVRTEGNVSACPNCSRTVPVSERKGSLHGQSDVNAEHDRNFVIGHGFRSKTLHHSLM